MALPISNEEADSYRRRWKLVNEAEIRELQETDPGLKLRQLAALMSSVDPLGWRQMLDMEETQVRNRWNRLRKVLSA